MGAPEAPARARARAELCVRTARAGWYGLGDLLGGFGERLGAAALGIDPHAVRIAGSLSSLWVIVSNFVVYPFVAVTDSRPSFVPAPGEVAHLLEVPVRDVRDQSRLHWDSWRRGHVDVHYPFFDLGGPAVWGATAMMLGEFACLFDDRHSPPKRTAKPDEIR